jgi:quercetin dioxygenase-like cupin family protein
MPQDSKMNVTERDESGIELVRSVGIPWRNPDGEWTGKFPGWMWKDLRSADGVAVSMWQLAAGQADLAHSHPDGDEHIFVLSGELESNGRRFIPGDYIFRPAGAVHSSSSPIGAEMLLIFVTCSRGSGSR